MKASKFNQEIKAIIKEYDCKPHLRYGVLEGYFQKVTPYGTVIFRAEPTPKMKSYAVFMQFEREGFKMPEFVKMFGTNAFNQFSLKWNLHSSNAAGVLEALDNRLHALTLQL